MSCQARCASLRERERARERARESERERERERERRKERARDRERTHSLTKCFLLTIICLSLVLSFYQRSIYISVFLAFPLSLWILHMCMLDVYIHICICISIHICICIDMYMYMYIYTYVYIYSIIILLAHRGCAAHPKWGGRRMCVYSHTHTHTLLVTYGRLSFYGLPVPSGSFSSSWVFCVKLWAFGWDFFRFFIIVCR